MKLKNISDKSEVQRNYNPNKMHLKSLLIKSTINEKGESLSQSVV